MEKIFTKEQLIDQALAVFQPRTSRKLTREDGRQIVDNLVNFFHVLQDWEKSKTPENLCKQADKKGDMATFIATSSGFGPQ